MAGNGWIKLHRKLLAKGYYRNSQYVHLWVHLLLLANHKEHEYMHDGGIILIKEGQLITGRKELSKATGIPETTIERILKMLESEHQIGQQKTNKYRVITILNWKEHQNRTEERTSSGHLADTYKNEKNEKNSSAPEDGLRVVPVPSFSGEGEEEERPRRAKDGYEDGYKDLCTWAEKRRGFKFMSLLAEYAWLKKARIKGIGPDRLTNRWKELEQQDFYIENGLDWKSVVSSFNKRA